MLNIYRKLFLALKKVQMVKITPPQVPTTQQKKSGEGGDFLCTPWKSLFGNQPLTYLNKTVDEESSDLYLKS